MSIRASLKRLSKYAKKRRYAALITNLAINGLPIKGKRMSEKQKKGEKITELQEMVDNQAIQLADAAKLLGTLKRDVEELKKTVADLKQVCSLGQ
ncbi:hypothetical protein PHABIO_337 [Pseudomonas phage Phabio]|uniref:Uncharacterized protein n=1 Tax=Pseudomonas phage Phabio TaxID=2006668 RepID=A0A1Y0T0F5_9CAUD|nr:hypothetical protein MZD05_gp337 [Pseudomonas phage Phabio]ARV76968.1 hypothetical protein PHABIO_337 [Pseudomonas phage Phabio]